MNELKRFLSEDVGAMIATRRYDEAAMNKLIMVVTTFVLMAEKEVDEEKKKNFLIVAALGGKLVNRLLRLKPLSPTDYLQ